MKRRNFVKLSILSSTSLSLYAKEKSSVHFYKAFTQALLIPPLAKASVLKDGTKEFNLNLQEGEVSFLQGAKTKTYGINGNFLGPTIKVERNDSIKINVKNSLKEESVIHWHGLHLEGHNDGGPNRSIKKNTSWSTTFKIQQRAATYWYHPHTHKKTGQQTYKGLAGLFIIEDEDSKKANLPREYGVDDIPLIIQDRRFDKNANFVYKYSMHDEMMGVKGKVFLVNGVNAPYVDVSAKTIRLRILNGSNARFYSMVFSNNQDFFQIAGDASFLEKPLKIKKLLLAPGERAEILVELSTLKNTSIYLGDSLSNKALLKINVKNEKKQDFILPSRLTTIDEYSNITKEKGLKIRHFSLDMRMMWMGINAKQMDMSYINEKVILGETEIWRIKNNNEMPHPFHIHGCSFKVLSRNNKGIFSNETGLKDTVVVYGEETLDLLVRFNYKASKEFPFMYHCHILEHEDAGMMGQFTVEEKK